MNARTSRRVVCATIFVLTAIEFLQLSMVAFGAGPIMGELSITPEDFSLIAAIYASVAILMISMQRWFVTRFGGRLLSSAPPPCRCSVRCFARPATTLPRSCSVAS